MLHRYQLERELTEEETILRDSFVAEYLKDFDPYHACIRIGFLSVFAVEWSKTLMGDSYVQRKISHMTTRQVDAADEIEQDRILAIQSLRHVIKTGNATARVAATRALAEIRGFAKPAGEGGGASELVEAFKDLAQRLPA